MSFTRLVAGLSLLIGLTGARADYVMSLSSAGAGGVTVSPGGALNLDVALASSAGESHNSAIFRLVASAPGLVYQSYTWQAPYLNGTLDDDSKPLMKDLPSVLSATTLQGLGYAANTVDVELANVTGDGSGFTNGTLVRLVLQVPADYQGPSPITLTVEPSAIANGFALIPTAVSGTFTITIAAVNTAPQLRPIPDQTVESGQTLSLTVQASDSDVPANHLTYHLLAAPTGATLDPLTGVFVWTPAVGQGITNETVSIEVTDNGVPPMSAKGSFNVRVSGPPAPHIHGIVVSASRTVSITWEAIPGRSYRLQYTADLGSNVWQNLAGDVHAQSVTASKTDDGGLLRQRFYRVGMLP